MKKIFFSFSIFLLVSYSSIAQVYHPFPDSIAVWSENEAYIEGIPGGHSSFTRIGWCYSLEDDTLIDSNMYSLLSFKRTFSYAYYDSEVNLSTYDTLPKKIFGALREDSSKRIWFRNFLSHHSGFPIMCEPYPEYCFSLDSFPVDSDILLYDFNLQIGDSIPWTPKWKS